MDPSAPEPRAETAGKGLWHPGEGCLVPSLDHERLCVARGKSVSVDQRGKSFAAVPRSDCQERKVPLNRLQEVKSVKDCPRNFIFDDEDLEKPYFPDREPPSAAVAFPFPGGGDAIPYTINRYLRDYQRAGAQFLYGHFIRGRGCILGDDMGLGKTVQVISFLAAVLRKKGTREDIENNMPEFLLRSLKKEPAPSVTQKMFLIVAPLSVLYNWRDELDTWGYFRVTILHGNKKDSELIRVKQRKCEIALTTYETLRLCLDELNSLEWSAVIVDEAHRIKNPQARITEVMKALTCDVRIGLTGTILQNNMRELWCVMDWAAPGLLGSSTQFKKQFSDPVEHGQRHTATKRELATGRKAMRRLAKKMSGRFLRRTKALIRDQLPKKEDRMVYCSLTDFQKAVYQTVLETEDVALILQSPQPCTCGSGRKRRNCCYKTNSHGETVRALYFSYLAVLQKVANHAALLQAGGASKQQETLIKRICAQVFSRFPDFVQKSKDAAFETLSDPKYSGKMKVLQQLLNHCRKSKDKVLLFSFSTKLLDVLQQYCMASGLDYRRLDGSTKSEDRIKIVKEFNGTQDVNICLVSTMAGGLGLNFVGANVVVLFDPTWNPANDLQAIDRAYRIGQCRDVKVFRLVSLGTVEEIMYLRQVYKQQLHCVVVGSENAKRYFEAVQGSKEHRGELFGVCNLFRLRPQGSCLTKDILEREGRVEAGVLTATTWLREGPADRKRRTPGEPDCHGHGDPEQPAEGSAKDAGDLCSDLSEDESVKDSRAKPAKGRASKSARASGSPGQLTLLQCGFSRLLEAKCQAVEGSDENSASDDESPDEQPTCLSTESKDVACPKSRGSLGPSKQQTLTSIQNPNEKCIFNRSERILEQNVSSVSDDEKTFRNTADGPRVVQNGTDSEGSDVVCPTQYPAERVPEKGRRPEPPAGRAEDPVETGADGDERESRVGGDGLISKHLNPEDATLKSRRKRKGSSDISDESDDVEMSFKPRVRKRRAAGSSGFTGQKENKSELGACSKTTKEAKQPCAAAGGRSSPATEDCPSSDDDCPGSRSSFSKQGWRPKAIKDRVAFSSELPGHEKNSTSIPRKPVKFSSERAVSQEQMDESMDKFLDGVQEVAYIHSNQNVIGSSKAENHMSRWAARDVFELKQFSQLPANVAVCTATTRKEKVKAETVTPTKEGQQPQEGDISFPLHISHPVRQKQKKVYRTDQTTFIIGETPKGTRRKHFEEMASYFNLPSVKEFAAHVTNATAEERQTMLRDFYASQHPEVSGFLAGCAAEPREPGRGRGRRTGARSDQRGALARARPPGNGAPSGAGSSPNTSRTRSRKTHEQRPTTPQTCRFGKEVLPDGADAQRTPASWTQETAGGAKGRVPRDTTAPRFLNSSAEGTSDDAVTDRQHLAGTGVSDRGHERMDSTPLGDASVAGLLGDTSILDDLFRSHGNSPTRLPKKAPSGPVEKARQRPKDFWDILNEQNGDSLSKLTDLAVIETLCDRAPRAAPSRSKEALEASLWKSNENFLWKKLKSGDAEEDTASAPE